MEDPADLQTISIWEFLMGLGNLVGGIVGFMVGGPPGAAAGAAAGGTKAGQAVVNAAGNVVKETADFTVEVVEGFGDIIWKGGVAIVDAIGDVAKSAVNLVHGTVAFRSLRQSELQVLYPVYGASVPYNDVVICSIIGMSNRPLTLPGSMVTAKVFMLPGIGPAMTIYALARRLQEKYLLCLGIEGYNRGLSMPFDTVRGGQTLVHEMMHVWQGCVGAWPWAYVYESVLSQCECGLKGIDAYAAIAGLQFRDYNVEQQARLVENWYCGAGTGRRIPGMLIPNADAMRILDVYMNDIIRARNPKGTVAIPATTNVGTTASTLKVGGAPANIESLASAANKPQALTDAQIQQFRAMAEQLTQQARTLRATGNPALMVQAQQMEQQAAQFRQLGGQPAVSATAVASPSPLFRR